MEVWRGSRGKRPSAGRGRHRVPQRAVTDHGSGVWNVGVVPGACLERERALAFRAWTRLVLVHEPMSCPLRSFLEGVD